MVKVNCWFEKVTYPPAIVIHACHPPSGKSSLAVSSAWVSTSTFQCWTVGMTSVSIWLAIRCIERQWNTSLRYRGRRLRKRLHRPSRFPLYQGRHRRLLTHLIIEMWVQSWERHHDANHYVGVTDRRARHPSLVSGPLQAQFFTCKYTGRNRVEIPWTKYPQVTVNVILQRPYTYVSSSEKIWDTYQIHTYERLISRIFPMN